MVTRIVDRLIARAQRTPYFHLAGYMNRWWLVPYTYAGSAGQPGDGTGWVSWRRPIARVLQHLGIAVRVHQILRSDTGRDPHDHPWPYITVILRGGYYESRYDASGTFVSQKWHGAGSVLVRRASDLHKLVLPLDRNQWPQNLTAGQDVALRHQPAWTLFITGRYRQRWGFMTPAGKVPHDEYKRQ